MSHTNKFIVKLSFQVGYFLQCVKTHVLVRLFTVFIITHTIILCVVLITGLKLKFPICPTCRGYGTLFYFLL